MRCNKQHKSAKLELRTCKLLSRESHPARFPPELARFFIKFLTDPTDVVVDVFSGSNTTGAVAEELGRRWLSVEIDPAFAVLSAIRFLENRDLDFVQQTLSQIEAGGAPNLTGPAVQAVLFR